MWSVVEKTALAEAEVEYQDYTSDTVWVKFPVVTVDADQDAARRLRGASIVIWTTTPWTIPGNRADQLFAEDRLRLYGHRRTGRQLGEGRRHYVLAEKLAADVLQAGAGRSFEQLARCACRGAGGTVAAHPLQRLTAAIDFDVPLLPGDHVTDDAGTGFVHTAPGHGREDFDIWTANARASSKRAASTPTIPYTVDENGAFTEQAPGFTGKRVINDKGEKGDANEAVIKALIEPACSSRAAGSSTNIRIPGAPRSR